MWGACGERGVRGDGRVRSVGAVGQRRGVHVVVVHHWAGQNQLEQTETQRHKHSQALCL